MTLPVPILLLARQLALGGCERDLTKLALTIDRRKFSPHVACFHEGFRAAEIRSSGVPVTRFDISSFHDLSTLTGLTQFKTYVRQHAIRLVHAYDLPTSIFAASAGRYSRLPAIVTSNLGHRELFSRKVRFLAQLSDRLAHRIVVNCAAMRRHLIDDEQVPDSKIFVSHNGFMPEFFHPSRPNESPWRPPQFSPTDLILGTVCVLRPEKNIPLLMRSFADLRPQHPHLKLLIVGSGSLDHELPALARQLGIDTHTHFEPARQDVERCYRALDIFALTSYSEAFPNGVLEAMASGCATVATRVGGIPELITDGETGFLFPNQDQATLTAKLQLLIADPVLRRRLAANAAQHALSRFTMQQYCQRMEAFYASLLSS